MSKIKIVLVDDHGIVRDGLKSILSGREDFLVTGEAGSYAELEELLKIEVPDIILMDISLPDRTGIEITSELRKSHPAIKVIILSMYLSDEFIKNSYAAGACGYLPKNTSKDELTSAVKTVYSGDEFWSPQVSKILLGKSGVKDVAGDKDASLSKREIEILTLYSKGLTNKEIAAKLFISPRTVESHKNHIMLKLNLKSQVEMVRYAIKNKLIEI